MPMLIYLYVLVLDSSDSRPDGNMNPYDANELFYDEFQEVFDLVLTFAFGGWCCTMPPWT